MFCHNNRKKTRILKSLGHIGYNHTGDADVHDFKLTTKAVTLSYRDEGDGCEHSSGLPWLGFGSKKWAESLSLAL